MGYKTIPQNRPRVYVENLQTNATVQHPPIFSNLDSYQVNNNNSNKKNASPIRRPQQHHLASGQSHRLPRRSPPCPSPPPTPRPHPPALTTHRRRLELLPGRHPHANLLADDIREIAICRVAVINEAWYEWSHHAPLAKAGGVSDAGLEVLGSKELKGEGEKGLLTEKQRAVVRYTDAMTRDVSVGEEVFGELKRLFSEQEVVEITATVACYNCVSRFLVALDVGERNGVRGPAVTNH